MTLADFPTLLDIVPSVCLILGGFFAIRYGRQAQLTKYQADTNTALQQHIEALEGKAEDFKKENIIQRHIIETITAALAQKGMVITITGDMVTIEDSNTGTSSMHRKRVVTSTRQSTVKQIIKTDTPPSLP